MKKCYTELRKEGISCIQSKEGRITRLVTPSVGTAF
jgi:hypothetical protein